MEHRLAVVHIATLALAGSCLASNPGGVTYEGTLELPTHSEGFHDWPGDEISAIEFIPSLAGDGRTPPNAFWVMPDDRSGDAPARIGRIGVRWDRGGPSFGGIAWTALRDEHGRIFEKNTVDPEAMRVLMLVQGAGGATHTIVWASEGYAKKGVQPAIYEWTINEDASRKWSLPDAFLHDNTESPTRGIFHNNGFESLAIDLWDGTPTAYAAVERPLIQDRGTGVCRVLSRDTRVRRTFQYGYPLGPAPEGTDPETLAIAELLCVGPRRFLALENAEFPDGETVASLFWISTDGASDLTGIASLKEADLATAEDAPRLIEKKLLLDFSTLPNGAGLGNFEGMDIAEQMLWVVEDNEHGKAGATRVLVLRLPGGLSK